MPDCIVLNIDKLIVVYVFYRCKERLSAHIKQYCKTMHT